MRLIESILFENGRYHNLALHQARVDRAFQRYQPKGTPHNLPQILPNPNFQGTYKVRMVYDLSTADATYDIEFAEYIPKSIQRLEVMHSKPIDYSMKFEDRRILNQLTAASSADDIIIAIDQKVTDGSYFNLVFWDGTTWITPDTPLLNGIRRTLLLEENKIQEAPVRVEDIQTFEKVSLINAMMDLGALEIPTSAIDSPRIDD